jgi:hypothetical protein
MEVILNRIRPSNALWNIYLNDITTILKISRITLSEFKIIERGMVVRFECNLINTPQDIYDSFKISCLLLRPIHYWKYLECCGIF